MIADLIVSGTFYSVWIGLFLSIYTLISCKRRIKKLEKTIKELEKDK